MLKTILWFIYFWFYLIWTIGYFIKLKILKRQKKEQQAQDYVNQIARRWAKRMVEITGSQVKVKGVEKIPDEPVLFVSNHQGAFDIPLLLGYINKPKAFIAKWELRYMPLISTWMKELRCIFIKRNDFRQTLKAFKNAGRVFKDGQSLVVFPEGTRSKSDKLAKFKRGSLKIALREEVPVVPVTIKDSYKLKEGNGGLIKAADVELIISDPIYTTGLSKEKRNDLTLEVRKKIASNL